MPPFHLLQNKSCGIFKYEKLNYSHSILNIKKIKKIFKILFFFNFSFEQKKLVRAEKVVRAPTRTMSCYFLALKLIQTLLRITRLATGSPYLFIICPTSH